MSDFSTAAADRTRDACYEVLREYQLPGLAIGVIEGDNIVYAEGFGFADIKRRREMSITHRQRIGSISKTMTGLLVMSLIEQDRLRLDTKIVELFPKLAFVGDGDASNLTIQHLLTHSGGIGEAPTRALLDHPLAALWSDSPGMPPPEERYPTGIEIEVDPGTKWAYANHGFGLLGDLLVQLEEKPLADLFRDRIFRPLAMRDSDIRDKPHHNLAPGYHRAITDPEHRTRGGVDLWYNDGAAEDEVNLRGQYIYFPVPAAGAVQSTVRDMARYASVLLRRGEGIVDGPTFETMIIPQWEPDPRLRSVGLSFMRGTHFGEHSFGHGGSVSGGWNSEMTIFPERNLAVLIHFNLDDASTGPARSLLIQAVVDGSTPPPSNDPINEAVAAQATGTYDAEPGELTNTRIRWTTGRLTITAKDGSLHLSSRRGPWSDGVPLCAADPADPSLLRIMDEAVEPVYLVLTHDDAGAIDGLLLDRCIRMVRTTDPT
jgi:CubicO group peptidase (beta-lactamase class C family)